MAENKIILDKTEYNKQYRSNNLEKCRLLSNERNKTRYRTDEAFRQKTIENAKRSVVKNRLKANMDRLVDGGDVEYKQMRKYKDCYF